MVESVSRRFVVLGIALQLILPGCKKSQPEPAEPDPAAEAPKPRQRLTIWWMQWAPSEGLQALAREFSAANGVDVRIHQVPAGSFQDQVFQEFAKKETAFDVVIGDSQWLGRGASKGHYLELTDWLPRAVDLGTIHPKALSYLSEYPTGSRKYFGAPAQVDAIGFAYRKDWFDDAKEKEAFKKRFKRDLAPPQTWDELKQLAEFFHRPDANRYGVALVTGRSYDELIMGFQPVLHAFGASWGDMQAMKVKGRLDAPEAVKGLDFWKGLLKFGPPNAAKLGYGEVLEPFTNGSTAICMDYFGFFAGLAKDMGNKVGFFAMPKQGDRRFASLGGQGFSISTKAKPEQQELAKKFIAWFLTTDTQRKWVQKPGGFTANAQLLASAEFKKATAYNAALSESMDALVDFWNVPLYNELIAVTVQHLGEALDGKKTSKEALTSLAGAQERILHRTAQ